MTELAEYASRSLADRRRILKSEDDRYGSECGPDEPWEGANGVRMSVPLIPSERQILHDELARRGLGTPEYIHVDGTPGANTTLLAVTLTGLLDIVIRPDGTHTSDLRPWADIEDWQL